MKKKIIFCIGSGRCGTSSAAFLLNSQKSSIFAHELFPILPWEEEHARSDAAKALIQFKFNQLTHQCHNYDIVGDAGSYYLPYAEVLIRSLKDNHDYNLKFLVLKRDKSQTVKSFLTKFKTQNNNPLQRHNGPKNEWDASFPKYDTWTLEDAVQKYYDEYYERSNKLANDFPEVVKVFNIEDLNSEEGLRDIFKFLEIKDPVLITNIRKNPTKTVENE